MTALPPSLHRFFRFSETLIDILGDEDSPVKLSDKQREAIQTYDRELEDFLSDFLVSTDDDGNLPSGDSLWEILSTILQPITAPVGFLVSGGTYSPRIELGDVTGAGGVEIYGNSGTATRLIVEQGAGNYGYIELTAKDDVYINPTGNIFSDTGNDVDFTAHNDFNASADNDINANATRDINLIATGQVNISARNTAPADGRIDNENIAFYLDQGTNTLKVRVRYSDGTLKTGTVALI